MRVASRNILHPVQPMKARTDQHSRATALGAVTFVTLLLTISPATPRESWPQRIEADWLLAEEVVAQDQLGGLAAAKGEVATETAARVVTR